jgi:lipid-A-disaccharide synthase
MTSADRPITVHLVAGEESGDALAGALMRALRERSPGIRFGGLGGRAMAEQGIASPFDIHELSIIGFGAVLRQLPRILRRIRQTADAVIAARPDALVVIDSPDFTHRVARRVREAAPDIPIVNYAPPSVWVWRPWRARAMRRYVDEVLAILPFEPDAFARLSGPHCTYVGHPLAERLADLRPNAEEARRRLADPPLVLVLPGSRRSEIHRLAETFGEALGRVAARSGPLELVLPTLPHVAELVGKAVASWPVRPRIVTSPTEKYAAFRTARAALAASGTVTLELAMAQVPMIAAYRISAWEALLLRRVANVDTVVLPNLVLGDEAVPERIQEICTADAISAALLPLLSDTPERRRQIEAFARLDGIMGIGGDPPSRRAADAVLGVIGRAG